MKKNKTKVNKSKHACPPTRRGSALIFATIILFSLLAITVTLSAITVSDMKMSQKTKSSTGAFFNADSGVEWALYKITNNSGTILSAFPSFSGGKIPCLSGLNCNVFLLDSDGKVISNSNTNLSEVKAVRSVGTQGGETQRAIEAAVAGKKNSEVRIVNGVPKLFINGKEMNSSAVNVYYYPPQGENHGPAYGSAEWIAKMKALIDQAVGDNDKLILLNVWWSDLDKSTIRSENIGDNFDYGPLDAVFSHAHQKGAYIIPIFTLFPFDPPWWLKENNFPPL